MSGVDNKARVLEATDIVELIGQTVKLRRSGRGYTGLCPFHQEKTPSFSVNPERKFYYCFGCKAHGNAIDFVMNRDRVEFVDALKQLADKAGITLPRFEKSGESAGERQQLLDAQSAACAYFQACLVGDSGEPARAYLEKRGFDAHSIKQFQIGYAPPGWDNLLRADFAQKLTPESLVKAGLLKHNEERGSFYDTFRNRLMFPIRDEQGRVIAFGGRAMPGSDDPAKYLNSPETPIFSKSRTCFGLDLARQKIVETRTVIVVEGYCDTIGCHQFGVTNVISVLGTSLTSQHVSLLRRFADRIVLLFDPDTAGDKAVDRAVEMFLTQPIEVLVASMPDGLDPDEFMLEHGAEEFNKIIAGAQDALNYKWRQLDRRYRASDGDMTGQQKAVEEYLTMLADARGRGPVDTLRWGAALTRVSRLTGIPVDELNRRFRNRSLPRPVPAPAPSADGAPASLPAMPAIRKPLTAQTRAERQVLGCLLVMPQWWHELQKHVSPEDFVEERNHKLAEFYWAYQKNEGEPVLAEFLGLLKELSLGDLAAELVQQCDSEENAGDLLTPAVEYLQYARQRRESARLSSQIRQGEGGEDQAIDMLRKLSEAAKRPDMRKGL